MPNEPIPENLKRVVLVNPTKYLGNLLLAGGLMQAYADYCQEKGIRLKIVIDESFAELCRNNFPEGSLIFYPRRKIHQAGFFKKLSLYLDCLKQIRTFRADLAFNIEEDPATSHLTRLSNARFKLGCSVRRHKSGYDHVIAVNFENRPAGQEHRWYSYYDVFAALGMPLPAEPSYINLQLPEAGAGLMTKLADAGMDLSRPVIALHCGATKNYKKWPLEHYTALCGMILEASMQPVLLGAGAADREANSRILSTFGNNGEVIDLCDKLTLVELGRFLPLCHYFIGNDSGPFHLGSALGVKGSVIFGPTNKLIWRPLGNTSEVIQNSDVCDPECSKGHCLKNYQCLQEISPAQVCKTLLAAND